MSEKPGRNDPCPCNSGKKFKNCCIDKPLYSPSSSLLKKKFTAKVISSGGNQKQQENQHESGKGYVDYATLLERSYGKVWEDENEQPPIPADANQYLPKEEN